MTPELLPYGRIPYVVAALHADGTVEPVPIEQRGESWVEGESPSFRARATASGPDVSLAVTSRRELDAGLRFEVVLGPTADPGWLVPGVFYGENRPAGCTRLYPRFVAGRRDVAAMESDEWAFRADRAATPAVFAWDAAGGAAVVTGETSPLGPTGVGFALRNGRPVLRVHAPYREEPLRYDGSQVPAAPDVRTHHWREGERVTLELRLYELGPDRHAYAAVLRELDAADSHPAAWVSVDEAAELAAWGLYRWHYRPDPPLLLETAAFDRDAFGERGDRHAMHVSWVSGAPYAYALLLHGRRRARRDYADAATAVLDHIAGNLAPGGTFWAQWTRSEGWRNGWHPDSRRLHARTLGDAALFVLRAARAAGNSAWEAAVRSNLDVAVRTQRADGALGAAYDAGSGDVLSWDGTAGLAWMAPLAESRDARYADAAQRAGAYYAGFVERGLLYGAPEDVDLAPTSEDGYAAVMAYVALYEADGDPAWLRLAARAADWTLTFRYTYDVEFPPLTLLGRYGFRSRGADQASPANQHLHAFGLICLPEMVRLARHTADPYYLETTRRNLDCFRQFIARRDGDFNAYRGMASERYYQTDCFQAKGMLLTLSHAWSVGVLLLAAEAALELPELA
jgi:hypothetical protein